VPPGNYTLDLYAFGESGAEDTVAVSKSFVVEG